MNTDESALDGLRATLAADDYGMVVREAGTGVEVRITAGPEACAECLVPKALMRGLLEGALGVPQEDIDLIYPTDVTTGA